MKKLLSIAVVLCAACTSDSPQTRTCPAGQSVNPVTGVCVATELNNNVGNNGTQNNTVDQNNSNSNNTNPNNANNGNNTPNNQTSNSDVGVNNQPGKDMGVDVGADVGTSTALRFVAIGDTGEGNDKQYKVAQSIGTICTSLGGCDFGLLLGDNFYDSGVDAVDDNLWMTHFAMPYGHLPFPFYAVLGNHDLGGDGLGIDLDFDKADYQVAYSDRNPKWIMPAEYYAFEHGPVFFVGLNTTDIFFNRDDDQYRDVPNFLAQATTPWKIAFGHHPYYSNGPHGNAGEYEGLPFIPIANGEHVEDFMEDNICGKVDFYLCGHDHSRQDLARDCMGTQFIVSGAGAKTTDLEGDNPVHFESDTEGFVIMEATAQQMKIQFYDIDGVLEHTRIVVR